MSDYGGDYDEYEGFFDDADWLYVEDAYDEAVGLPTLNHS